MKAASIRYEKRRPASGGRRRRPPSVGRRRRPTRFAEKARSRGFSIDGCVNDAVGRRTSMSRSGSAYANPDTIAYTYNNRSELTGALSNVDTTYSYSYTYDPIGNRVTASEAGVPWTYTTNSLNQYTSATENNTQLSFAYDLDGNMTYRPVDATSGWTQIWNGENRMVETYKGNVRLTFKYDYMGRRVEKCVYAGNTLTSKTLFVYDGFKCVEELDGLDNNAVLMRRTWQPFDVGLDVILATTDGNGTFYFLHDANKNVMQKMDSNGTLLEHYAYAPFGNNTSTNEARLGFSSERLDESNMVYYNFRYFSTSIGKWIKRDSLEEISGNNLYAYIFNMVINDIDFLGLVINKTLKGRVIKPPCSVKECIEIYFILTKGGYLFDIINFPSGVNVLLVNHWFYGGGKDLILSYDVFGGNPQKDVLSNISSIANSIPCNTSKHINDVINNTKQKSKNPMIYLYSEKIAYECIISKKCEGKCCKLAINCSWLVRATDKTDFNNGQYFNALYTLVGDAAVNHCFKKGYSGPLGLNIAMDFNISATKFGSFSKIEDCSK